MEDDLHAVISDDVKQNVPTKNTFRGRDNWTRTSAEQSPYACMHTHTVAPLASCTPWGEGGDRRGEEEEEEEEAGATTDQGQSLSRLPSPCMHAHTQSRRWRVVDRCWPAG